MIKISYKPLIALALAVMMSLVAVSAAPTGDQGNTRYINSSGEINDSGKYLLMNDITGPIIITSDDVTFDGNGYCISGDSFGVYLIDCKGATVRDTTISCQLAGIVLQNATNCMIEKNNVTGCYHGIALLCGSDENKIINNDVCNNNLGCYGGGGILALSCDCDGNKIHANTVLDNGYWYFTSWWPDLEKEFVPNDISLDEEVNDISGNHVTPEEE